MDGRLDMSTPRAEVAVLKLPDWLPPAVKFSAQQICRDSDGASDIELLNRLISDVRMRKVWDELNQNMAHLDSNAKFINPLAFYVCRLRQEKSKLASECIKKGGAKNEALAQMLEYQVSDLVAVPSNGPDHWLGTDCAIYCFLCGAYQLAMARRPLPSQVFLDDIRAKYLAAQKQLMSISEMLTELDKPFPERDAAFARAFPSDSEVLARIARKMSYNDPCRRYLDVGTKVIKRERSDSVLQGFLVRLSTINRFVFRSPLYGTLAKTANVALCLDQPINEKQVRAVIRSFPDVLLEGRDLIRWRHSWQQVE
jgi:hypothetical protein